MGIDSRKVQKIHDINHRVASDSVSSWFPAQSQSGGIGSVLHIGLIQHQHARISTSASFLGREKKTTCFYRIQIMSSSISGASGASGLQRLWTADLLLSLSAVFTFQTLI